MREINITPDFAGMRLDRFIKKACPDLGKSTVQKLIRKGDIKINGKKAAADTELNSGDILKIYARDAESTAVSVNKSLPEIQAIYEDDFLLAVNKPPFLPSQPSVKGEDSVTERIKAYLSDTIASYKGLFTPGIVNRLDTNTSGIVLAGKTPAAQRELHEAMAQNKIDKKYLTLVRGDFKEKIKATHYAVKDEAANMMKLTDKPFEGAITMITVFEPVAHVKGNTLLSAKLITGKTHQIRAQLAYMGYPVALDKKYGKKDFNEEMTEKYGLKRQFLHCAEISLKLWYDQSLLKITCELPDDLQGVLDKIQ